MAQTEHSAKPFIKWAGGKGQLLTEFRKFYPTELGVTIKKYCEPMVGGGAVLFDILNSYDMDEVLACDINPELINTYEVIKTMPEAIIGELSYLEQQHLSGDEEERKLYFYSQREKYNDSIQSPDSSNKLLRATLFIYLNKTCFNGLYRVNRKGLYNVPVGSYKNPKICDSSNILAVSQKLQNVTFITGDYSNVSEFADDKTFMYFDPPYRPLSKTSDFTSYNANPFGDDEQLRLGSFIKLMSEKKVKFLASNSDPKNTDENDDFFENLYSTFKIHRVSAKRSINSKSSGRGSIQELLISNY